MRALGGRGCEDGGLDTCEGEDRAWGWVDEVVRGGYFNQCLLLVMLGVGVLVIQ